MTLDEYSSLVNLFPAFAQSISDVSQQRACCLVVVVAPLAKGLQPRGDYPHISWICSSSAKLLIPPESWRFCRLEQCLWSPGPKIVLKSHSSLPSLPFQVQGGLSKDCKRCDIWLYCRIASASFYLKTEQLMLSNKINIHVTYHQPPGRHVEQLEIITN